MPFRGCSSENWAYSSVNYIIQFMSVDRELIFLWKRQSVVKSSYKLELGVWTLEGASLLKTFVIKFCLGQQSM